MPDHILVVDDDPAIRELVSEYLADRRTVVDQAASCREALEILLPKGEDSPKPRDAVAIGRPGARTLPDVVLLDMRLPDGDGLDVLAALRRSKESEASGQDGERAGFGSDPAGASGPGGEGSGELRIGLVGPETPAGSSARSAADIPVIVITADSGSSRTIRAMQAGAYDYLVKPLEPETVRQTVRRALEQARLSGELRELHDVLSQGMRDRMVGSSPAMQAVYKLIGRVAESDAPVLITGQTGTGKELVAETLHKYSRRRRGPLIRVNCAALPESLLESELFGHEKGAFTGAVARREGRFELAEGGSIFLDEIGELSLGTQKKFLRVVQFGEFERVGGNETLRTDARIIAATNRDLEAMVRDGTFREDLFYRLNVIRIELPSLAERREDLPALVAHFLDRFRARPGAQPTKISAEALDRLLAADWPGNVRQLENTIQRAVVMSGGRVITPDVLEITPPGAPPSGLDIPGLVRSATPLKEVLADVERQMIAEALLQAGGNRSEAARLLHVYRRYLYQKMEEYALSSL